MAFDTQRAVVATGDGIVARFPGVLCVARCADAAPVRTLLALCADAAGADPGRELARRFATWLTGPDAPSDRLAFGTLAAAGDQLAVFLVGPVAAWVDGPDGPALSGADAAIGTDRLLPRPSVPVVLSVGEVRLAPDVADVHDLRSGVVAGAAAVLHPPPARAGSAGRSTATRARPADVPERSADAARWTGGAPTRAVEDPAPDHDWFAARPEPPPATGPWDATPWPSSPNGSATPRSAGSATVVVPAGVAAPGASGRHAILDPTPAEDPVETRSAAHDQVRDPGDDGGEPVAETDRPEDAAGADARRSLDAGDTAELEAHRAADAATVSGPLPDTVAPEPAAGKSALPVPSPVPRASPDPAAGAAVEIDGYLCEQGHLSDPRAPFCGQCGAPVDDRASALVSGTRPALGRLVFDDGAAYAVDDGMLVGRLPESDDRVQTGEMRPVVVEDPTGSVSRVHAEIQISGWDVMLHDAGSRNGTFVAGPEDSAWSPLPPERGRRLLPGTRVRMGGRTFVYESSSGLR